MSYRLLPRGVLRIADNLHITPDMLEWEEYRQWRRDGGVADPEIVIIPPRWTSLEAAQTDLWATTRNKRDSLEAGGFPYMGHPLDSDPRSVQRINTAVQAAQAALQASQPFQIGWTCMDDHTLDLDAVAMISMPVALALTANALHVTAKAFKVRIHAATSIEEIETIEAEVLAWGAVPD